MTDANHQILFQIDGSNNPAIEMRGSGQHPYIDFSNDTSSDYDMRIILEGDDMLGVRGGVLRIYDNAGNPGRLEVGEVWFCTSY